MIIEGNSFLEFINPDYAITCARAGENKLKSSARRTLAKAGALYLSTIDQTDRDTAIEGFEKWRASLSINLEVADLPIYTREGIPALIQSICELGHSSIVTA